MRTVKLFLTDVDGCLTDGGMYYSANGDEMKRFCVYDGMGAGNRNLIINCVVFGRYSNFVPGCDSASCFLSGK